MKYLTLLVLLGLALVGCDTYDQDPVYCTAIAAIEPGMVVEIIDAATGEYAADGALGLAVSDAHTDTLQAAASGSDGRLHSLSGVGRPGTYTVVVSKDGYQNWRAHDVVVRAHACGLETVHLSAELERPSPS